MSLDDHGTLINHIFFADNGFFLAESVDDCIAMFEGVTRCLYAIGFEWKPSSLQIMILGEDYRAQQQTVEFLLPDGSQMPLQTVGQMDVLGALIGKEIGYREALDHRLNKGERVFRKYQKILCGRGAHREKLLAFEATASSSAVYSGGTLSLTCELARHAHSWELRLLRQALRLRPRADETVDASTWAN